jgi:hypothetical protein
MRWWAVALVAVAGCAVGLLIGVGLGSTYAGPSVAGLSPAQLQQAKLATLEIRERIKGDDQPVAVGPASQARHRPQQHCILIRQPLPS